MAGEGWVLELRLQRLNQEKERTRVGYMGKITTREAGISVTQLSILGGIWAAQDRHYSVQGDA